MLTTIYSGITEYIYYVNTENSCFSCILFYIFFQKSLSIRYLKLYYKLIRNRFQLEYYLCENFKIAKSLKEFWEDTLYDPDDILGQARNLRRFCLVYKWLCNNSVPRTKHASKCVRFLENVVAFLRLQNGCWHVAVDAYGKPNPLPTDYTALYFKM